MNTEYRERLSDLIRYADARLGSEMGVSNRRVRRIYKDFIEASANIGKLLDTADDTSEIRFNVLEQYLSLIAYRKVYAYVERVNGDVKISVLERVDTGFTDDGVTVKVCKDTPVKMLTSGLFIDWLLKTIDVLKPIPNTGDDYRNTLISTRIRGLLNGKSTSDRKSKRELKRLINKYGGDVSDVLLIERLKAVPSLIWVEVKLNKPDNGPVKRFPISHCEMSGGELMFDVNELIIQTK